MALKECNALTTDAALHELLLCIGDSHLVLAQQLGALIGWAPTLEEEVACANIGLDILGHATMTLELAAERSSSFASADDLAFTRDAHQFRSVLLAEFPAEDFAQVIVRQLFFSAWSFELWSALSSSADADLSAIACKARKEAVYHVEHAGEWFVRLGAGTAVSRQRTLDALDAFWPCTAELFAPTTSDALLAEGGICPLLSELEAGWNAQLAPYFAAAAIDLPTDPRHQTGGRTGRHTEHLGHLLTELQFLQRTYPGATW